MAAARRGAIICEGAELVVVGGTYDDAVKRSAEADGLLISDTSWPGYERVPSWVIEGYSTMLWEIEDELGRRGEDGPDLVVVQAGVGALAAAVARHFRSPGASSHPKLVAVEPAGADCLLESIRAERIVSVPGPHDSIMAGLNCGTPSLVAWPTIAEGIDLFLAVDDEPAREAMRLAARSNVVSGETGASGLGGLLELLRAEEAEEARLALGVSGETRVLLFNSEGATDPDAYERIMAG
ncbi:MAG: pyridoxal-phosphate dependent enzyme [Rubrobacter sp.]|nr:pyridoxal-phosphate dependent enzyme [Rubrobacter sp.]